MGTSIESFVQAASSFNGAGYVKLTGEGNKQEAVQYGGHFFARHCGWFSKPSAEQNAAVRANLLQTLARSPEKFSDKAINVAARALGMQGDETLQIAYSPLSKREVLQVINQTRVFDRNEALGLNNVKREDVPEKYLELFDKVMSGGTDAEAAEMVLHVNFARFDQQDIHNALDAILQSPDGQKFAGLGDKLFRVCFNSVTGNLSNATAVKSSEEIKQFIQDKVQQKMTDKIEAHQAVLDLADPAKTNPPISDVQKNYLLERSTTDEYFTGKSYVQLLGAGRDAAIPFFQTMGKENPSMQEIADAFEAFTMNEARTVSNADLGTLDGGDLMGISNDLMQLAGLSLGKGMNENGEFPATEGAQKTLAKFYDELNFVNNLGSCGKNFRLPNDRVETFPEANRIRGAFCNDAEYHDLKNFSEVSDVTKNFLRHFGATICEKIQFNKDLSGDYGSAADDYFASELKSLADKGLAALATAKADPAKFNDGKDIFQKLGRNCYVDLERGFGLKIGDTVVNEQGHCHAPEGELLDKMKACFTKNGVFDEEGFAAVTAFANQSIPILLNVDFPANSVGPLSQILSTPGGLSQFDVTPNDDGSYSVTYTYENKHLVDAGIYGTPDYVRMDPEADNTFKAQFSIRLAVVDGKAEISTEKRSTFAFHIEDEFSAEQAVDVSHGRMDDATSVDNIQEMFTAFVEEQGLQNLAPLSDEELARVIGNAQEKYKRGRPVHQVSSKQLCQSFVEKALKEMILEKVTNSNRETREKAVNDDILKTKVENALTAHPEYASLKENLISKLRDKVFVMASETTDKLLTAEDYNLEVDTKLAEIISVKESLVDRINLLASEEAAPDLRLSAAKKDWLLKAVHEEMLFTEDGMLNAILENQNNYGDFIAVMSAPDAKATDMVRTLNLGSSELPALWREHMPDRPMGSEETVFFAHALLTFSELNIAEEKGSPVDFPKANIDMARRLAADLQGIGMEYGSMSDKRRLQGPVHGSKQAFQRINIRGANIQAFLDNRFQDLEPLFYSGDFSQVSNDTKMCLMDAGIYLNDYTGTAHAGESHLSRKFASDLQNRLSAYNAEVLARELPVEKALAELARDQARQGMGITFNGQVFSRPEDKMEQDVTIAKFIEVCTPAGEDEPDLEMIRTLGAIAQQSLAADFQDVLRENSDSPFMSGLGTRSYVSHFEINGNPVQGFEIKFDIDMKLNYLPRINDLGEGTSPQMLEDDSSWSAGFTLGVQRNAEGKIEISVKDPGAMKFDVRPRIDD